jgi:hypothetical protein
MRAPAGMFGIAAVLGAAIYSASPRELPPKAATSAFRSPRADAPNEGPLDVLDEFAGSDEGSAARAFGGQGYRVRFVVATLPDPIDSHYASAFDRGLEAIVSAMSDAGYSLDRWKLPWRAPGQADIQAVWSSDEPGKPVLNAKPPIPGTGKDEQRTRPGAILFRKGAPNDRELVVLFVVGETPTHGLQKGAFRETLRLVREFQRRHPESIGDEDQRLPILGPYFSGSAESLRIVLSSESPLAVRIVSGSATSDTNKDVLSGYESTTRPDSELKEGLRTYLEESIGVQPKDVAFLVEDGTSYGENFARDEHLVLRFPLQISQLRGAYEKREARLRGPTTATQLRRTLEISLEGPERTQDALPTYDSRMTAGVAELVLANLFDTVRRQNIRYLGLVASDSRDILFLARKAREYASDANLFTFGADVLYQHPDALPYLDGLLVATTYPLLGPYQAWHAPSRDPPSRRSLAGASEEGIYNAMLVLLGRCDRLLDYASPSESGPGHDDKPPVWIVANGRNGFWPVFVWSPTRSAATKSVLVSADPCPLAVARAEHLHGWPSLQIPPATLVLFAAWSAVTALLVIGHMRYRDCDGPRTATRGAARAARTDVERSGGKVGGPEEAIDGRERDAAEFPGAGSLSDRLRTLFGRCSQGPDELHEFTNLAGMSGLFLVLSIVEASITAQILRWSLLSGGGSLHYVIWWCVPGTALALGSGRIWYLEMRDLLRARSEMALNARIRMASTTGSVASVATPLRGTSTAEIRGAFVFSFVQVLLFAGFAALVAVFTGSVVGQGTDHAFLVLNRSFNLGSRAGPLLPLCLGSLVLALFAMCHVRRSLLYEEQRLARAPLEAPQSLQALLEPYSAFTRLIRNPSQSLVASIAPCVGFAVFHSLFVGAGWYRSFDGRPWNVLATVLLALCTWCVAWAVLEFREIWRRLSTFLRILSWSPLADAFNRMPDGLAKSQWKMWRAPPTLTSLHVSVSHLKTLVSLGRDPRLQTPVRLGKDAAIVDRVAAEVVDAQREADAIFTRVLRGTNRGHASTRDLRKDLRGQLALATLGVCRMLETEWNSWPSKADIKDKSDKDQEALNTVVWLRRQMPSPPDVFVRIAEEFVAVRFVSFIHYAFSQMRNVLSFALVGFLLLMAFVGSYPFQPFHPVVAMAWVLGLFGIAGIVWTFIDMDRDLILSYIAKTKPGRVNLNLELLTNLFLYAVIPLLTLLATQFPDIGDWILSFLNPAMRERY